MKYFTFDELTYSRTAVENGLSNWWSDCSTRYASGWANRSPS